jgi:hypothetical protein
VGPAPEAATFFLPFGRNTASKIKTIMVINAANAANARTPLDFIYIGTD